MSRIEGYQHLRTKELNATNDGPKAPSINVIKDGEIAVNYLSNNETLFIKNDTNEIVSFKDDKYYTKKFEEINSRIFIGTQEEYNTAYAAGKIAVGALVIIMEEGEDSNDAIALLGTAVLGKMILGQK